MPSTPPRWFSRTLLVLVLLAVVIRVFYWSYTDRTWEDALITALHSENAVSGLGLTHAATGEPPVQGFSSPLSMLLLLLGDMVHIGWGLPLLKLLSAVFGGIAVWLGARICLILRLPPAIALIAAAYLAFEHHQIMWGMAGMETQLATVAYLYSLYCMMRGSQWQKGLSLGFTLLARPDAIIWVIIACSVEIWRARKARTWSNLIPVFSGLALVYAPWLIFTSLYYGSPIPNTILAKSLGYHSLLRQFQHISAFVKLLLIWHRLYLVLGSLGPGYGGNGTGLQPLWDHHLISLLMTMLAVVGAIFALRKRHTEALLLVAFVASYTFYLTFLLNAIFGWYAAPLATAAVILSLYGLWHIVRSFATQPAAERLAGWTGVAYIAAIISVLPATFRSDKYIQQFVEWGVRKPMGLYLATVSLPTDTVASESLGYVGYYSRRTIYDYPGLCSRKVVQYLRDHPHGRDLVSMAETLRPKYLILRPKEYRDDDGHIRYPWINQDYELVRVFKAPEEARHKILHSEENIDFEFDVFGAKTASDRAPLASVHR